MDFESRMPKIKVFSVWNGVNELASRMIQNFATAGIEFGAVPSERAMPKNKKLILHMLCGYDMVFVAALPTDDAAYIEKVTFAAECAREAGALTVGVIMQADDNSNLETDKFAKFEEIADSLFVLPSDQLFPLVGSINSLLGKPGKISIEFDDVKPVLSAGAAAIGIGKSGGENAVADATHKALEAAPLKNQIQAAKNILLYIMGASEHLDMMLINEASLIVQEAAHPDASILFGADVDDTMEDNVSVMLIASDFAE